MLPLAQTVAGKGPSKRLQISAYVAPASFFGKSRSLSSSVELLGALAAVTTTLCWLPQLFKILRERQASGISLATNAALASGVFLWCVYGVLIASWPVIAANAVTLLFILAIVGLKLRYG
jgi:MtN3 and saliva related transmembrane protein